MSYKPTSGEVGEKKIRVHARGPAIDVPPHIRAWAVDVGRKGLIAFGIPAHCADALLNSDRMRKSTLLKIEAFYNSVKGED